MLAVFLSLHVRESKTVELGFQIPIVSGILDPLSCILDSRYSIPVFVSRIQDSNL